MKKLILFSLSSLFLLSACVSKKEFLALEEKNKNTQDLLNTATVKLNKCLTDEATASKYFLTKFSFSSELDNYCRSPGIHQLIQKPHLSRSPDRHAPSGCLASSSSGKE